MDQVDREEPQRLEHHVEDLPRYQDADPRERLVTPDEALVTSRGLVAQCQWEGARLPSNGGTGMRVERCEEQVQREDPRSGETPRPTIDHRLAPRRFGRRARRDADRARPVGASPTIARHHERHRESPQPNAPRAAHVKRSTMVLPPPSKRRRGSAGCKNVKICPRWSLPSGHATRG